MSIIDAIQAPPQRLKISAEAFWERFTNAEFVLLDVACQHEQGMTDQQKKDAAKNRIFRDDTNNSGYRNLGKSKVRNFVLGLESTTVLGSSVLAAGRAAVILDTTITEEEAYKVGL